MPGIFKDRIVKFLKHSEYEPLKLSQLARALGVGSENYEQFKNEFDQLRRAGHVIIGARNLISLPSLTGQIVGTFRANPKGFGFITPLEPNSHGDLFIPPDSTAEAMTGDIVMAKVKKRGKRGEQMRYSGEVVQILERAQNRFVGTLSKHTEGWIVQPDGKIFIEPISVDDVTAKGAKEKDKVVVEIMTYPTDKFLARGVIIKVLGKAGQYDTEIKSIITQYHIPVDFDPGCFEEARRAAADFKPDVTDGRVDITDKTIVTIDPPDAKDFDDAISLETDPDGNWVLGVHIADVSSFVTTDSPLDVEARLRGNSVYLPGKTIPMLPEILSNGICSLQPQQKRFVKSVYITYNRQGKILSRSFANSVMCSTQRLTYQQADRILKGHTKDFSPEVIKLLRDMEALSRAIEQRRRNNGMIHLDLPETELDMDESGRVVDAHPADDSYPHTIIEMFMVEANDAVASLLDRQNVPFIRRIHAEPDALAMKNLARLVKAFGLSMPRNPDRKAIQDLLAAVKGRDCAFGVNLAVLRSFEKAQYAPLNIGHYALASTHYCHFTSPIRRYADLLVHRDLEFYLRKRMDLAKETAAAHDLVEIGKHISFTEQRAEDAERELITVLILQMLSDKIGTELDCVVTGLTTFGLFVQSKKYGVEGLIRMTDLGPGRWQYNEKAHCITSQNSGKTISLGQPIKVRITSVNVPARQMDVMPAEPAAVGKVVKEKTKSAKKSGKSGRNRRSKPRK
jgi:ribonuclease R